MKNTTKQLLGQIAIISALLLSFSFPAFAQDNQNSCKMKPNQPMMMGKHCMMQKKFDDLLTQAGVTPEQKQKIDVIWQQARTQSEPIMLSLREKRKALFDYISSPQANKDQALAQLKDISQLQYQLESIRINSMFQVKCILTPEQQQKLTQLIQEKMKKHEQQEKSCPMEMPPAR